MINGELKLRKLYPFLKEDQYQPAGIDLTLGDVMLLEHDNDAIYGLLKDAKVLPKQKKMSTSKIIIDGKVKEVFKLEPHMVYIGVTAEKIKIDKNSGQSYKPRSSLLRAGIDVRTAFGDPGFHGHLSFLLVNHTDYFFVMEKGVSFAQLIDMNVTDVVKEYDGDYNEE